MIASSIADFGLNQRFIFAYAHSINTTIVSIPVPNAKIKLKLVKKLSESHSILSAINVIKKATIIRTVAVNDCQNHVNNAVTNNINKILCIPLDHKVP